MNREAIKQYIAEIYHVQPYQAWQKYPNYWVFRHNRHLKWFALIMDIPKEKLDLDSDEIVDVMNVKCSPEMIGSLRGQAGIYPAYHMNKEHWVSIILDGTVAEDTLLLLLDMSYELTYGKNK